MAMGKNKKGVFYLYKNDVYCRDCGKLQNSIDLEGDQCSFVECGSTNITFKVSGAGRSVYECEKFRIGIDEKLKRYEQVVVRNELFNVLGIERKWDKYTVYLEEYGSLDFREGQEGYVVSGRWNH